MEKIENEQEKIGAEYLEQCTAEDEQQKDTEDTVMAAAKRAFGISYLYPWQRLVIENILDSAQNPESEDEFSCHGKQIVLLPTGAGKSMCFLVPSLLLKGPTLVLYPLLALMSDQKRRMDDAGIESVVFRGGQSKEEREENFARIHNGAKIILANPEVLLSEGLAERLALCKIAHVAIDEAHCVSEWGDTFRPAYLELGRIIRTLEPKVVTAFTATASSGVLSRISDVLFGGPVHIIRSDSDRPNIRYYVVNAYSKKRAAFRLAVMERKPLIIFCGTRGNAEDMARELAAYLGSDKVKFYHAGLEREEKDAVEKWFYPRDDAVLCCTCAFGMGVDKKDIHCVIHLEPSPTAEAYLQEAGRGGRDGSVAKAILLWSRADSERYAFFKEGSRERVLAKFAESTTCRRQILLDALGGEQAACSGCDVCERGEAAPFASDAGAVLKLVGRRKKSYDADSLSAAAVSELNRRDLNIFGEYVWNHADAERVILQLMGEKNSKHAAGPGGVKLLFAVTVFCRINAAAVLLAVQVELFTQFQTALEAALFLEV